MRFGNTVLFIIMAASPALACDVDDQPLPGWRVAGCILPQVASGCRDALSVAQEIECRKYADPDGCYATVAAMYNAVLWQDVAAADCGSAACFAAVDACIAAVPPGDCTLLADDTVASCVVDAMAAGAPEDTATVACKAMLDAYDPFVIEPPPPALVQLTGGGEELFQCRHAGVQVDPSECGCAFVDGVCTCGQDTYDDLTCLSPCAWDPFDPDDCVCGATEQDDGQSAPAEFCG